MTQTAENRATGQELEALARSLGAEIYGVASAIVRLLLDLHRHLSRGRGLVAWLGNRCALHSSVPPRT